MAITKLAEYEANETEWPGYLRDSLNPSSGLGDEHKLANTYYDAERVFYNVKDKTSDTQWDTAAGYAQAAYEGYYVTPNNGGVPGYWSFPTGLTEDYLRTGDTVARNAVNLLRTNAAFHTTGDTSDDLLSRENAYALMAHIDAVRCGYSANTSRIDTLFNNAMGHIEQWCETFTAGYFRPFMGALTAEALIHYFEHYNADPAIPPKIAIMGEYTHTDCLNVGQVVWNYTDRDVGSTDPNDLDPQPDLGMLILPYFGWLWTRTGEQKWLDRADAAFDACVAIYDGGGFWVSGAYLGGKSAASVNGKHVCQNYRWSRRYLTWRAQTPVTQAAGHRRITTMGVG